MKHKRGESGFSLHLILIVGLVVAALGLSGWYVFNRHRGVDDSTANSSSDFEPGAISVTFGDGVTFQQAKSLINSLGLSLDQPDAQYEQGFTPWDYRAIKTDQFDQVSNNLKAFSEVSSFVDASSDGSSRAGSGYKWVKVTFKQGVALPRIETILKSSGLGLGETPDHPVIVDRMVYLKVPDGKEKMYINQFKQNSIVLVADRVGRPELL